MLGCFFSSNPNEPGPTTARGIRAKSLYYHKKENHRFVASGCLSLRLQRCLAAY